jgi:hypothetical protein
MIHRKPLHIRHATRRKMAKQNNKEPARRRLVSNNQVNGNGDGSRRRINIQQNNKEYPISKLTATATAHGDGSISNRTTRNIQYPS